MKTSMHLWSFLIISRSFLLRMKNVSNKCYGEIQNTHFVFSNFFSKIMPLWVNVEKYCRAGHATWQYGVCALHSGYLKTHTHTLSQKILLFRSKNGYANAPQCFVYMCIACVNRLFSSSLFDVSFVVRRSVAAWMFELVILQHLVPHSELFVVEGRRSKKLTYETLVLNCHVFGAFPFHVVMKRDFRLPASVQPFF